jgi:hypothetical protein
MQEKTLVLMFIKLFGPEDEKLQIPIVQTFATLAGN